VTSGRYGQVVSDTGTPSPPEDDEAETADATKEMADDNPDVDDE